MPTPRRSSFIPAPSGRETKMNRKVLKKRLQLAQKSPSHAETRLSRSAIQGAATVEAARTLGAKTTQGCVVRLASPQTKRRSRVVVGTPPLYGICVETLKALQAQYPTCRGVLRQTAYVVKSHTVEHNRNYAYRILMPTSFDEPESLSLRWKYWKYWRKTYQLWSGAYGHHKFIEAVTQIFSKNHQAWRRNVPIP